MGQDNKADSNTMAIFDEKTLTEHLRGRDFIDWIDAQMEKKQDHHIQDLYERRQIHAEVVALESYHALIWTLQSCPQIEGIRPIWIPDIDEDKNMIVRVRVEIKSSHPDDKGYENTPCSFGSYPPSFENDADTGMLDTLIELCEGVGPETWNEFCVFEVANRKTPYTSVEQIESDMNEDIPEMLARLQERLMEHDTQEVSVAPRSPSPRL